MHSYYRFVEKYAEFHQGHQQRFMKAESRFWVIQISKLVDRLNNLAGEIQNDLVDFKNQTQMNLISVFDEDERAKIASLDKNIDSWVEVTNSLILQVELNSEHTAACSPKKNSTIREEQLVELRNTYTELSTVQFSLFK